MSLVNDTWRGETYKMLDSVSISANCRVRKIFTMKNQPPDTVGDDGNRSSMICLCFRVWVDNLYKKNLNKNV